jgi:hypothetical protein
MLRAVLIIALVSAVSGGNPFGVPKAFIEHLQQYSFYCACFGEEAMEAKHELVKAAVKKCQMQEPEFDQDALFGKGGEPDEEGEAEAEDMDIEKAEEYELFKVGFAALKEGKVEKLGNLSCVMKELRFWNNDRSVNIDFLTGGLWDLMPDQDPDFVDEAKKSAKFCHKAINSLPEYDGPMMPFKKMFGKQLMFHQCFYKCKKDLCAKKMIVDWMEKKHGPHDEAKAAKLGLPPNKFDAGMVAVLAKKTAMTDSAKFVGQFLHTGELKWI